ncbi:unnamed protein product, partial [Ectocarpus sp. 8 AP-2014]
EVGAVAAAAAAVAVAWMGMEGGGRRQQIRDRRAVRRPPTGQRRRPFTCCEIGCSVCFAGGRCGVVIEWDAPPAIQSDKRSLLCVCGGGGRLTPAVCCSGRGGEDRA